MGKWGISIKLTFEENMLPDKLVATEIRIFNRKILRNIVQQFNRQLSLARLDYQNGIKG